MDGCAERKGGCWRTDLGVVLDAFLDDGRDSELALGEHVDCVWEEHRGMEGGVVRYEGVGWRLVCYGIILAKARLRLVSHASHAKHQCRSGTT